MVDIVVLNFNDYETTLEFVSQFSDYKNISHIVVVDNCSTDDSFFELERHNDERFILIKTDHNGGYGFGNNAGIRLLTEKYSSRHILIANPDTQIDEQVINELSHFLDDNPKHAIVTPLMYDSNNKPCYKTSWRYPKKIEFILSLSGFFLRICTLYDKKRAKITSTSYDTFAVAGSLLMIDAKKFVEIGGFDEGLFLYCEETALGFRAKHRGYKTACLPSFAYKHNHSISIDKTYKSKIQKYNLLFNSKMYVLDKYYMANKVDHFVARFLSNLVRIRYKIQSLFKKRK